MADRSALSFPTTPLLCCPFCGNAARWFRTGRDVGVECTSVDTGGCPGCAQTDVYAPEHAADAAHQWNRRPDSRESASTVELLESLGSTSHLLMAAALVIEHAESRAHAIATARAAKAVIAKFTGAAA